MAKGPGGTKENPHYAIEVRAGKGSPRRLSDNHRVANNLERQGYEVERDLHENGAYLAVLGKKHDAGEIEIGRIFAESGMSFTLGGEGASIVMPDGRKLRLPYGDGLLENDFTHEIYRLNGSPNPATVADGIKHSFKVFSADRSKTFQADVAITATPKGSAYHKEHIDAGVTEYIRQMNAGEAVARPLIYLHVDMGERKVYYRRIK